MSIKSIFSTYKTIPVTLTFGQGHQMSYHFEGLLIDYLSVKYQNSTLNNGRDQCQKLQ